MLGGAEEHAAAQRPLKVFLSADMEGVAGIVAMDQLGPPGADYEWARHLMTAEVKSIPLAHALSVRMKIPYVVARKTRKPYMVGATSVEVLSITTGAPQTLWLDGKDQNLIKDKKVILVDDVISTGSTLAGMEKLVSSAGGEVVAQAAVFTEGNDPEKWKHIVAVGSLPVFS